LIAADLSTAYAKNVKRLSPIYITITIGLTCHLLATKSQNEAKAGIASSRGRVHDAGDSGNRVERLVSSLLKSRRRMIA
jgi:hypothetical protein